MRCESRTWSRLLGCIALCAALAVFVKPAAAQQCITGPEVSCGPAELCGPEGYGAYYWAPPGGGVQTTRCILATESGTYNLRFGSSPETLGEPCFFKFHNECGPDPKECEITGPREVCPGQLAELCGPEGYTYAWTGPGGFASTSRCITVGPGVYHLEATLGEIKLECSAEVTEKKEGCTFNCPRTPGFWGQQCRPDVNGSVKFTTGEMNQITSCIDDRAAIFNWGSSDFSSFCSIVNPAVSNQRTNAKKHFATFLANLCTDQLNLITNNGDEILLDPSTPVSCNGTATTIGDLVGSIDAQLVALEGQSLSLNSVKNAYSRIIECIDPINNSIGIGPVCGATSVVSGAAGESRAELAAGSAGALEFAKPYPNPMTRTMQLQYTVQGAGSIVKIGVYDLAGRKVRELVSGIHSAGVYRTEWNARDASGTRVSSGVYFVRGTIGSQVITRQVIVN